MVSRIPLTAAAVCLVVSTMAAAAPAPRAPEAAASIARRLVAGSPAEAESAMAEAFGWAGITTVDAAGKVVTNPTPPTLPVTLLTFELRKAALSAREAPVISLADLGKMLFELGAFAPLSGEQDTHGSDRAAEEFMKKAQSGQEITEADLAALTEAARRMAEGSQNQLEGAAERWVGAFDGELAGLALREVVGQMILAGRTDPANPHAFVPLLIEALAKERAARDGLAARDLASGELRPEEVELSLTEAHLLMLGLLRGPSTQAALPAPSPAPRALAAAAPANAPVTPSGTPCSDLVEKMGDFGKAVPHVADYAGGKSVNTLYDLLGKYVGEGSRQAIGYAAKAIRLLLMVLNSADFEITADPVSSHYAHKAGEKKEVAFHAKVTLPPPGRNEHPGKLADAQAADCLNTALGFNLPDSSEALTLAMKDWTVFWALDKLGPHATVSEQKNNFQQRAPMGGGLEISGHTGRAKLVTDMTVEDSKAAKNGRQVKGTMTVTATLDQSGSIDPTILFKAGLNPPDALLDVLIEWGKKMAARKRTVSIPVTWHEPKLFAWEGTITHTTELTGGSDVTNKTPGRAPPAIAVGAAVDPPGEGSETFHDEGSASRTVFVTIVPGREGERIHKYSYVSKDHAKRTHTEKTPEVCITENGIFKRGVWTLDALDSTDTNFEGKGLTTVTVRFNGNGSYEIESPIPYASGWVETATKYEGNSSCTGQPDPENYPLKKRKAFSKIGNFLLQVRGKGKPTDEVLKGSVRTPIKENGTGASGTVTLTWNLKRTVVEWSGE